MLYNIQVYFQANSEINDHEEGLSIEYGFREVKLRQDPLPGGRSFYRCLYF